MEKGLEYASKGLQLAQKAKNKKMESAFNRNLGIIYFYQSSYDTAKTYLDKSLSLALDVGDEPLEMKIYVDFGNLYYYQQDYQTALEYYLKGLALGRSQPDRTTAVILNNVGMIHRTLKNPDRAISFLEEALDIAERLGLNDVKMSAYTGLGGTYADKGEPDKAIEYLQDGLSISREAGNKFYEIAALVSLSAQFRIKEEYDKALRYSREALRISEEIGSTRDMCNTLSVMSEIYLDMKNYRESEITGLKSWALDSVSYDMGGPTALTLSVAYIHLGEKNKAEYFIRKYHDIATESNDKSLHESLAEMEVRYETEKKEMHIASLEKERRLYVWLGIAGGMLALSLGVVLWLKMRNSRKERQLVASNAVQEGEMGERERIAGELHDRLLGSLSAVKSEINNTDLGNKLNGCIEEVRRISRDLMPLPLRNGIKTALEDFTAQFPEVRFHFFGEEKRIEKRLEFVLYCCANELVSNSIRHSGAKNMNVQLVQGENHVALTVQDDGSGFDEKTITKGVGLKSVRDRVASCNGKINIFSAPDKGTETVIELHLK